MASSVPRRWSTIQVVQDRMSAARRSKTSLSPPVEDKRGAWLGLRSRLREMVLDVFHKVIGTHEGKSALAKGMSGMLTSRPALDFDPRAVAETPYADLGSVLASPAAAARSDVILISARFRSGSTLLWNLFRHAGCTAYYEPLNERRWFDPLTRGTHTDPTHRQAKDYWREYDGLVELGAYYDEEWTRSKLFLPADAFAPDLKRYVEILIDRAPHRPVLQFNRIDFRLPWFKRHFPRATLLHLVRHPREQWLSCQLGDTDVTTNTTIAEFEPLDKFYLLTWTRDLKYQFPFLDETEVEHPYELFYYVWKLSYLFGRKYADVCVKFEDLTANPSGTLAELCQRLNLVDVDAQRLGQLVEPVPTQRWPRFADDAWFRAIESRCESRLAEFFAN